jgi:hypothetical protein
MEKKVLMRLQLSHRLAPQTCIPIVAALMRLGRTSWVVFTLFLMLAFSGIAVAQVGSEFLEQDIENGMASGDILALLDQTVGTGANPANHLLLRQGLYVTATPQGSNIILRFEVDRSDTNQSYTIAEVAISADLGRKFLEFVKAALRSAESAKPAQPWELGLDAESNSGGQVTVKIDGDATAHFTLSWEIASPKRPIDSFIVPTAFGSKKAGTEHISVVVHFPTSLQDFAFLSTIYVGGVEQRFHDLPLYPHTWLHLTVTDGSTNRFVIVHFDAITTNGQRLFVAEAPASTDVGGRFLNETLTRMQEKPGSSGKWQTEFYYDDPDKGVVVVAVTGENGGFDVAYHLETPTQNVTNQ